MLLRSPVPLFVRYLLRRALAPLGLCLVLIPALVFALQAARLGHHLTGAGLDATSVGALLLLSLPTLVAFALPLGLATAQIYSLGSLAESGELLSLRSAGAGPLTLARPGLLLTVGTTAASVLLVNFVERPALRSLETRVLSAAGRALLLGAAPRTFNTLLDGHTIYFDARLPSAPNELRVSHLFLAAPREHRLLAAESARLSLSTGRSLAVSLELANGELLAGELRRAPERLRFGRLTLRVPLERALRPHFGFLAGLARDPLRPWSAAASCLALGLCATVIGVRAQTRLRGAALCAPTGFALHGVLLGVGALWPHPAALAVVCLGAAVAAGLVLLRGGAGPR